MCLEGTGCPQCQEVILGTLGSHGQHLTLSPAPSTVQELYTCWGLQAPQRPGELGIHVSALRGEVSSRKVRKRVKVTQPGRCMRWGAGSHSRWSEGRGRVAWRRKRHSCGRTGWRAL